MEWLSALYEQFGPAHPRLSLVVASLIGMTLFGGGWWLLGKRYQRQLPVTRQFPGIAGSESKQPEQPKLTATVKNSTNSNVYQAARDLTINNPPSLPRPQPVTKLPFNEQVQQVRARIRYLARTELKSTKMGLHEVFGPVGDGVFDGPERFDQREVLRYLAGKGDIEILSDNAQNLVFEVQGQLLDY